MSDEIELATSPEAIAWKTAQRVARTAFVPDAFRNRPEEVFAAVLYGRELGWGPMRSLHSLNVIKGKVTMAPEAMRALVQAAGHTIVPEVFEDEAVRLLGRRVDTGAEARVTWTIGDARRAGLVKPGGAWTSYPRAMLLARATSELCRLLFADVLVGASYTEEEAESAEPAVMVRAEVVETVDTPALPVTIMGEDSSPGIEQSVASTPDDGDGAVAVVDGAHEPSALDDLRTEIMQRVKSFPSRLVGERRKAAGLPLVKESDPVQLAGWSVLLDGLDAERPM